jgi:hypothetical protein
MSRVPETSEPDRGPLEASKALIPQRPLWQRAVVFVLKLVVSLALLAFLALQFKNSWERVRAEEIEVTIQWPLMAFSILAQAAGYYALGLGWHRGFVALGGGRVPWYTAIYFFAWTNLVRYVPGPVGKALLPVARSAAFKPRGVPASVTIASMALECICTVLLGLVIFAVTIPFQAMADPRLRTYSWVCLIALPLLAALHPAVFQWLVRQMGRVLREDVGECQISFRDQVSVLGWWVIAWVFMAGSFYPYVAAVAGTPLSQAPLIAASYAFAWVLSMILLIMPAGLGIREGVLLLLLTGPVGPLAGILSVASRLWTLAAEGVGLLAAFLLYIGLRGRDEAIDDRAGEGDPTA